MCICFSICTIYPFVYVHIFLLLNYSMLHLPSSSLWVWPAKSLQLNGLTTNNLHRGELGRGQETLPKLTKIKEQMLSCLENLIKQAKPEEASELDDRINLMVSSCTWKNSPFHWYYCGLCKYGVFVVFMLVRVSSPSLNTVFLSIHVAMNRFFCLLLGYDPLTFL